MFEPKKDKDPLDELKKRLYTRGSMGRRSVRMGRLPPHSQSEPTDWRENKSNSDMSRKSISTFKKFFIGALVFFALSFLYAGYQFCAGGNLVSAKNINISVLGPAFVAGGEEISLQVSVENRNTVPLEFAELLVEYQKGASSLDTSSTPDMVRNELDLGKVPAGGTGQQIVKATLYGEEGNEQNLDFTLEYRVQGSNAIFQKKMSYPVKISSAPVSLAVSGPSESNAGQDITVQVVTSANASKNVPGTLLQIDYPPGFTFKQSDPKATYGNNVWKLGDLNTGSSRTVRVTGTVSGQNGDERTFRVLIGNAAVDNEKTIGLVFNSSFHTVSLHRPFLDAAVSLNGDSNDSVPITGGREVKGEIYWKNNLPTRINNAEVSIKFSGNAFERSLVAVQNGFYNSAESLILWDRTNTYEFQTVEPGETGRLSFSFMPLPAIREGNILKQPEIDLEVTVKGDVNASEGGGRPSITTEKKAKVSTELLVSAKSAYSSGPFVNTGPLPPVAEQRTTYTVIWNVTNSSNTVSSAVVTATLPPYVAWQNQISPANENITYNETARTVTWRAGSLVAGTGYGTPPKEAAFQVRLTPTLSHVGSSVSLIGETRISGRDEFTGARIESGRNALTTVLSDSDFTSGKEIVQSPAQ